MKKSFIALLSFFSLFIISFNLQAATSTQIANQTAILRGLLIINKTADLNFATLLFSKASGTTLLTVPPTGAATVTNGGQIVGTPVPAAFSFTGDNNLVVTLTVTGTTLIPGGGGTALAVPTYTLSQGSVTLNSSGAGATTVGAALSVPSSAVADTYTGTLTLTANY
ncbi:putative DUF4402 domain-containing protein [Candidatus Hepatincolaceae symbiont of Richtersius coronifer]